MAKRLPSTPPNLPGFTVVRPLGTGGFADVFLYEQNMPRRSVAVKVLLADIVDADVVRMFNAEADVMARLSSHPSILTVYQASIAPDGRPYLVTEFCPAGVSPRYRKEQLPLQTVLDIGVRVGAALETAHRAGVLHRDIKPSNILFTAFGTPVLADFGIATSLSGRNVTDLFAMSVPWSAPEVVLERTTGTVASEIWSLGATIYTLLAGRSPAEIPGGRNSADQLKGRIAKGKITEIERADVPPVVRRVLAQALTPAPERRQRSAGEFAAQLQQAQQTLGFPVTALEVASAEWAGAGATLGFADTSLRGPRRSEVQHPSSRRQRSPRFHELRTSTDEAESVHGSRTNRLWLWAATTVTLVVAAVGATLWLAP